MKSEQLIEELVANLTPIRRLPAVSVRALCWALLAAFSVATLALALGLRADLRLELRQASFVRETVALFFIFALAVSSAFQLSIPSIAAQRRSRLLPLLAVGAWFVLVAARSAHDARGPAELAGLSCVWKMLGLALLPAMTVFSMLRKAAPFEHEWVSLMASLSALSLAILGTQFVCAKDDPTHVLVWHFSPLLIAALVGASLGRWLLKSREEAKRA